MRILCLAISLLCVLATSVTAAPFHNLDFEQASVVWPGPGGPNSAFYEVSPALAFPGWTINEEGPASHIYTLLNSITLGASTHTLFDDNPWPYASLYPVIQGHYSAYMLVDLSIYGIPEMKQFGTVPADARALSFAVRPDKPRDARVLIDGIELPVFALPGSRLGVDVSAYAGRDVELTISTVVPLPGIQNPRALFFDDIQFSPVAVPEPSTLAILLAALPLGYLAHRRR